MSSHESRVSFLSLRYLQKTELTKQHVLTLTVKLNWMLKQPNNNLNESSLDKTALLVDKHSNCLHKIMSLFSTETCKFTPSKSENIVCDRNLSILVVFDLIGD